MSGCVMSKTIEQLVAAKSGKVIQELYNLIVHFEANGRDMGSGGKEFLSYIDGVRYKINEALKNSLKLEAEYKKKAKKCPNCGNAMRCYPVNTKPGNQVGDNWRSQWRCASCDFNKFSENDYRVELKNHGIG